MADEQAFSIHVTHAQITNAIRETIIQEMRKIDYQSVIEQAIQDGIQRITSSIESRVDAICKMDLERILKPDCWFGTDRVSAILRDKIKKAIRDEADKQIAGLGLELEVRLVKKSV